MTVPGEGPQTCLGMVVGEAPGRSEVEQGRPFVGRAGKLLETALRAVGVARDGVYITNTVKKIPLDSEGRIRRPNQEEIEAWRSILEGEIQSTAPAAILALGRTAAYALTDSWDLPFGSRVNFVAPVFTAWHPSYLLHRGHDEDDPLGGPDGNAFTWAEWLVQIRPWAEAVTSAA